MPSMPKRGTKAISTDKGMSWHVAQLAPPLSQDSWVMWTYQWTPLVPGQYALMARATDGTGQTQSSKAQGTVPNGAMGYDREYVELV